MDNERILLIKEEMKIKNRNAYLRRKEEGKQNYYIKKNKENKDDVPNYIKKVINENSESIVKKRGRPRLIKQVD